MLWELVSGHKDGSGLLCLQCFDKITRAKGIELYWSCTIGNFPNSDYGDEIDTPITEETWIDEPLPRIPLEVYPINVMVTIGGKGKPRFKVETLINIYDDAGES